MRAGESPELDRDGSHDMMAKPFDMGAFEAKITAMMARPLEKGTV
jgi:hypothetical protein